MITIDSRYEKTFHEWKGPMRKVKSTVTRVEYEIDVIIYCNIKINDIDFVNVNKFK